MDEWREMILQEQEERVSWEHEFLAEHYTQYQRKTFCFTSVLSVPNGLVAFYKTPFNMIELDVSTSLTLLKV